MKTVDLIQGTPEWHAHRANHFNASDAPAMMGCSPYKTRAQLLRELHTGLAAEVDAGTQRIFDAGHRFEALARPIAESIIGDDLYPCVGVEGRYSASFDGLTLGGETAFEHKTLSADLARTMRDDIKGHELPLHYRVQMEHQCMVSGAERVLFMATKWADDETLIDSSHCWYEPDAELRAAIIAGWEQFAADLAAYVPPAVAEPAPAGRAPETLPALRIEVTGMVTASNLAEFKATALGAIRSVNRELRTDQDFADAEKAVKWCADVEARLKAAKEHALSQTADIDALFKTLDDISAEARSVRLDVDKLVKRRKDEVREQAVTAARAALDKHIATLQAELAPMRLQPVAADFAGAIKGLRSIASMQDALDTTLANAKIAADAQARVIRGNVATFKDRAAGLESLFADLGMLVHKAADDFAAVLDARIAKHRADEARREQERQAAEAARIAAAEAAAAEAARQQERDRLADEQRQQTEAEAAAPAPVSFKRSPPVLQPGESYSENADGTYTLHAAPQIARVAPAANEPPTLKLGTICERLGFAVRADFLADVLHIPPRATDKAAKLYRESDWPLICQQLQAHIGAMAELYAPSKAA